MRLSIMPEPTAADVVRIMRGIVPKSPRELALPWLRSEDRFFWLSRSCWSMCALADCLSQSKGRPARIWLPEYFCNPTLWPLRQRNVELHFYPIDSNLRPQWPLEVDKSGSPDLFFLVHYFGHAIDGTTAKVFCRETGSLLVEDATHAIGPVDGIGELGDFVLYSPWKFFPVPNAALLVVRPSASIWFNLVDQAITQLGERRAYGLGWFSKLKMWAASGIKAKWGKDAIPAKDFLEDTPAKPLAVRPRPSPLTSCWLTSIDIAEAMNRRRANDQAIRTHFRGVQGWAPLFKEASSAPWRSVFLLDTVERARIAFQALRAVGVEAEAWPLELPEESQHANSVATLLRQRLLGLPCYQRHSHEQLIAAFERSGVGSA